MSDYGKSISIPYNHAPKGLFRVTYIDYEMKNETNYGHVRIMRIIFVLFRLPVFDLSQISYHIIW